MTLPKFRFIPESARIAYRKKAAASSVATGDNVMLKDLGLEDSCVYIFRGKKNVQPDKFVA